MPEYRRYKRKNVSGKRGWINDRNSNWVKAVIKNLCQAEVCLTTKTDIGSNSAVEIGFLPHGVKAPVMIGGRVRHVEFLFEHNCFFSEIAFENAANEQKQIFEQIVGLKSCIIKSM